MLLVAGGHSSVITEHAFRVYVIGCSRLCFCYVGTCVLRCFCHIRKYIGCISAALLAWNLHDHKDTPVSILYKSIAGRYRPAIDL